MLNKRMIAQQLALPRFDDPATIIEWMGAVQAQDLRSVKWAVGLRMNRPAMSKVMAALDSGKILRTHIMRPTWHLVPGKDLKWMASLNEERTIAGFHSWAKQGGIKPSDFMPLYESVEKILEGQHLTKQEICEALEREGLNAVERLVSLCLSVAEAEARICSGVEKQGKNTYALYGERVKKPVVLSREEALAELAKRYFRSHGPASADDFVWWSGLGKVEARKGIASLGSELDSMLSGDRELFFYPSNDDAGYAVPDKVLHLLPPYDEYLISYKVRSDCIRDAHVKFAHNNFGIFQPVILHNGRITGNWRKTGRKTGEPVETPFFEGCRPAAKSLIDKAWKRYSAFLSL